MKAGPLGVEGCFLASISQRRYGGWDNTRGFVNFLTLMSSNIKNKPGEKHGDGLRRFPDATTREAVGEYHTDAKAYWKAIDRYRDLAIEFHKDIMGACSRGSLRSKANADAKPEK
jgi:hypothetical protein